MLGSQFERLFIIFWYEKTTERTEDTENYYNSVISASSVVDYPYLYHLYRGFKKSQFLSEFTSDQKKLKRIHFDGFNKEAFSPFAVSGLKGVVVPAAWEAAETAA